MGSAMSTAGRQTSGTDDMSPAGNLSGKTLGWLFVLSM